MLPTPCPTLFPPPQPFAKCDAKFSWIQIKNKSSGISLSNREFHVLHFISPFHTPIKDDPEKNLSFRGRCFNNHSTLIVPYIHIRAHTKQDDGYTHWRIKLQLPKKYGHPASRPPTKLFCYIFTTYSQTFNDLQIDKETKYVYILSFY